MGRQKIGPWYINYRAAKDRCNNPNNSTYRYYGGKGIKFKMSLEDFEFIWFRDRAYLLKQPSVDRKDSNKNYTISNCRYVEMSFNIARSNKEKPRTKDVSWRKRNLNGTFQVGRRK